ncbi:major facilitator superfamily domain-containing protein [Lipomyces kononenkoae]|uniref:Major facilitator superfamily domain-containing protein n=1 Tax=Lipomyces kononenkoae TaxID=34357 RepID=A0ACC3TAB0_LIPKO
MLDIIRSSFGGEIVHLLSGGRLLKYPDQQPGFVIPSSFGVPVKDDVIPLSAINNDNESALGMAEKKFDSESDSVGSSAASTLSPDHIVDWYGPDDPENPRNWSNRKKLFVLAEICILTFSVYIGSAMYSPGIDQVMAEFGVNNVVALLPLAVYVAAYGIGPMIFAPLSEAPLVGRNWIYIPSLLLFAILQIPTALVKNIGGFIVVRMITGLVASPPLANGGASIGDIISAKNLSYGLAIWSVSAVLGPVFGPFLGSIFAQIKGWRWTFWCLSWISGLAFVVLLFLLPETSEATILHRRARRLRKLMGNNKYTTKAEQEYANMSLGEFAYESFVRPVIITFKEPGVFFLNSYTALIYAVMYSWFEAFPLVFIGVHHFNLIQMGLSYFGILVGVVVAASVFCATMYFYVAPRLQSGAPPETIFRIALFAAPVLPASLLMFGWSSTASVNFIVPIIASGLFLVGGYTIFQVVFNYLGMSYPRFLASVFAGNDLFRSCFAAAFPLFAKAMFVNLDRPRFPVAWGSTLLAGISLLMVLIPIVLLALGHRLRSRSKYAN